MKKSGLLARLEQLKNEAVAKEIDSMTPLKILDLLIEYINDPQIATAIDEIQF